VNVLHQCFSYRPSSGGQVRHLEMFWFPRTPISNRCLHPFPLGPPDRFICSSVATGIQDSEDFIGYVRERVAVHHAPRHSGELTSWRRHVERVDETFLPSFSLMDGGRGCRLVFVAWSGIGCSRIDYACLSIYQLGRWNRIITKIDTEKTMAHTPAPCRQQMILARG